MEVSSKPEEAVAYLEKATSVCKARIDRLTNEVKSFSESTSSETNNSIADKQAEIEILAGLSSELEKKVNFVLKKLRCLFVLCYFDITWNVWNCSLKIYSS